MHVKLKRLLFASAVTVLATAQQPDIRVPVRLVVVPTLVLSRQGKVIDGLSESDFRLYDNHRPQQIKVDPAILPLSVAVAVQTNNDVREYLPFIAKVGSVIDTMLLAQTGDAAVLAYDEEIRVMKPFGSGVDVEPALQKLSAAGGKARMIDAGLRAISLLAHQPGPRSRVLLFIGQAADHGSDAALSELEEQAERENVSIYTLTLPLFGKSFVSDSFKLSGLGSRGSKGGYKASVELTKLLPALESRKKAAATKDPFSVLTAATGGIQLHFRKQRDLENALTLIGQELRSRYLLTYSPDSHVPGFHEISVMVDVPDAKVFSRPGYTEAEH